MPCRPRRCRARISAEPLPRVGPPVERDGSDRRLDKMGESRRYRRPGMRNSRDGSHRPESLDQQHRARRKDSELIAHRSEAAIGFGRIDGMRRQDDEIDVVRANELKDSSARFSYTISVSTGNVPSSRS